MQVQLLWANNPWENTNSLKTNSGRKLYSKVLTIEPNRFKVNAFKWAKALSPHAFVLKFTPSDTWTFELDLRPFAEKW
jgi:hypothetical protein